MNFGFIIKYNKKGGKRPGQPGLIRHLPDGSVYRIKSNALYGLALGTFEENGETYGYASFSGKGTYIEPGWPDPIGNYEFIAYIEDRNEPGSGADRIWIRVKDKDGLPVEVMSMAEPAQGNAIDIAGGNIVAPHARVR